MEGDERELIDFLAPYAQYYEEVGENGAARRIKCLVTGHEMSRKLAAVRAHFDGRRFKAKADKWVPAFDYTQYEPHIIPDRSNPKHFLFCRLTQSTLMRLPRVVEAHVQGRRYRHTLEQQQRADEDEEAARLEDDVDQNEMPEFMRRDADLMLGEEEQEEGEGEGEEQEDGEQEPRAKGRRLVQLEEEMPVFQGRKKRKKHDK